MNIRNLHLSRKAEKVAAYEIYKGLNIIEGDDKIPPAKNSRQEVLKILQKKHFKNPLQ